MSLKWFKIVLGALIVAITASCFIYTLDLKQKNPETIFLTSSGLANYNNFLKEALNTPTLVVKFKSENPQDLEAINNKINFLKKDYNIISHESFLPLFASIDPQLASQMKLPFDLIGEGFVAYLITEKNKPIINAIQTIESEFTKDQALFSGTPFTNYKLDQYSKDIQQQLFPLMFLLSFILLIFITRNLFNSILLFVPCLASALISLATIKWFYITMNMITSIVPLITFSISLSLAFHIYYTFCEEKSFIRSIKLKKEPILLMLVTTSIGFGSLYISKIQVIKDFALLSSLLIIICSAVVFIWLYSINSLFKIPVVKKSKTYSNLFSNGLSKTIITTFSIIAIALAIYLFPKITILTDATSYFPKESNIKKNIDEVATTVSGMPLMDILIQKDDNIELMAQNVRKLNLTQNYKVVTSNLFNMFEENKMGPELISLKNNIVSPNFSRLILFGKANNYSEYNSDLIKVKEALSVDAKVNGLYYNLMQSQKEMIAILYKSLLISLFVIAFLALLYTRKVRVLFIFLFVNIVPISVSLIVLYLFDLSINIATVMTYSISLGIIVDSSFHLIHILNSPKMSFENYFNTTVKPIVLSTLVFLFCFCVFITNSFVPIHEFGINLVLIISLGFIFDLFVLPTVFLGHKNIKGIFEDE